jgi:hypothetical protein
MNTLYTIISILAGAAVLGLLFTKVRDKCTP